MTEIRRRQRFSTCKGPSNAAEATSTTLATPLSPWAKFYTRLSWNNNTHVITQMVSVAMWLTLSTPWPLSSLTSFLTDLFLQTLPSLPESKPESAHYNKHSHAYNPNSEHFHSPNAPFSLSKTLMPTIHWSHHLFIDHHPPHTLTCLPTLNPKLFTQRKSHCPWLLSASHPNFCFLLAVP